MLRRCAACAVKSFLAGDALTADDQNSLRTLLRLAPLAPIAYGLLLAGAKLAGFEAGGLAAVPAATVGLFFITGFALFTVIAEQRWLQLTAGLVLFLFPAVGLVGSGPGQVLGPVYAIAIDNSPVNAVVFMLLGAAIVWNALPVSPLSRSIAYWLGAAAALIVGAMLLVRAGWNTDPAVSWQTPNLYVLPVGAGLFIAGLSMAAVAQAKTPERIAAHLPVLHLLLTVVVALPIGIAVLLLASTDLRYQLKLQQHHGEFSADVTQHNLVGLANLLRANTRNRFQGETAAGLRKDLQGYLSELTSISRLGVQHAGKLVLSEQRAPGCELPFSDLATANFSPFGGADYATNADDFLIRIPLNGSGKSLIVCIDMQHARVLWLPEKVVAQYQVRFGPLIGVAPDSLNVLDGVIKTVRPVGLGNLGVFMSSPVVTSKVKTPEMAALLVLGIFLLIIANWGLANSIALRRRMAQLQARRSQLELILQRVSQGVVVLDESGAVRFANAPLCDMVGVPEPDLQAADFSARITLANGERVIEGGDRPGGALVRAAASNESLNCRLLCGDGEVRRVEVRAANITLENADALLLLISDFTGIDAMQLQLREHNQRIAEVNRELEEFSFIASHDLREPLRTITSFIKLLKRNLGDNIDEQSAEDLRFIEDAAARMNLQIAGLLQLSRAGRRELDLKPVLPETFIEPALLHLSEQIQSSGCEISYNSDGRPVTVDAHLFEQLVELLVSNAIKFQPPGNQPKVKIECGYDADEWYLRVSDNGIGIDPEFHNMIFGAFKRLHGVSEYPGTGSGLAVVKKIVERHRASVHVESHTGEGATFEVRHISHGL